MKVEEEEDEEGETLSAASVPELTTKLDQFEPTSSAANTLNQG